MWLYRLFLYLYPAGFRAEYGEEMTAVFAEKRRRARNIFQVTAVWMEAVYDIIRHAVPLHLDALRQDLRYTLRSLHRAPGFAATVILVSALGIGANTAVFTATDRVFLRPLPFAEPNRLVRIWESPPGYSRMEVSPPNYHDWLTMATSFDGMAAYARSSANLVGQGDPVRIQGAEVSPVLLSMLGVQPLLGRLFSPDIDVESAARTVILAYSLWQRDFGADPNALGRTVTLDDQSYVVVGVMPREFLFPDRNSDYWTTLQISPGNAQDRNNNYLEVLARLKPRVSLAMAQREMRQVMTHLEAAHPVENERNSASVNRLGDEIPRQTRLLLVALMGASLAVLLIACTNIANLLLARGMARRREMAVRSSLGAGRERLVRQLFTESLTLAAVGGAVGVVLAHAALPLLSRLVPPSLPIAPATSVDLRVLLFALVVTGLTGMGFGALPAVRVGREAAAAGLRESSRGGGLRTQRLRATLVVIEVAASVVLLIASGLLIRALMEVRSTDPGFQPQGVLTARTWLSWPRYATTDARSDFYRRVLTEVRALPGVQSAAYTSFLPLVMGGGIWPVEMDTRTGTRAQNETASLRFVTPAYFDAMGIPMLRGRDVSDADAADRPFIAVVSQSFVERYFPNQDPVGRTFRFAYFERIIVGMVDDVHVRGLERESEPQVYLSHQQVPDDGLVFYAPKDLAIRTAGDPLSLAPQIRDIVRRADPAQPVSNLRLLGDIVAQDTASRNVQLRVLGTFAGLAFFLAAVGIHGLLSFTATQRAREIGVRMALGANKSGIAAMFLREGIVLGLVGVAIGTVLGYGAGNAMGALLFGIGPLDPVTFGGAIALSLVMTVVGSLPPALRAANVDAQSVMREA